MGPMTGDVSVYGLAVINGANLYLDQVNANGGINGKMIESITMDEQGDATQAVQCFTKMVDEGIVGLVGQRHGNRQQRLCGLHKSHQRKLRR